MANETIRMKRDFTLDGGKKLQAGQIYELADWQVSQIGSGWYETVKTSEAGDTGYSTTSNTLTVPPEAVGVGKAFADAQAAYDAALSNVSVGLGFLIFKEGNYCYSGTTGLLADFTLDGGDVAVATFDLTVNLPGCTIDNLGATGSLRMWGESYYANNSQYGKYIDITYDSVSDDGDNDFTFSCSVTSPDGFATSMLAFWQIVFGGFIQTDSNRVITISEDDKITIKTVGNVSGIEVSV